MQEIDKLISGQSASIKELKNLIGIVAPSASSVLIQGETGTGKDVVANAIHAASQRNGRLVSVNCAAIPAELLESELFGHEKGAFTGAVAARKGRFELAEGGFARAVAVANRLRLFGKAVSWGGAESLVITGHKSDPMDKGGEGPRIPAGLLRLSIGFEGAHALIEDLDQALAL